MLILVIALLVLLALIGTTYLSTTQTERYSSVQNGANTQADLLIEGLSNQVGGTISGRLFGNTPSGTQFRPPQPIAQSAGNATSTGYLPYTYTASDTFLADRLPTMPASTAAPSWNAISFPLFTDASGVDSFDSPFEPSVATYAAVNKSKIVSIPTYKTFGGQLYPAQFLFVPSSAAHPTTLDLGNGSTYLVPSPSGAYLTQGGILPVGSSIPGTSLVAPTPAVAQASPVQYAYLAGLAGNASGDGIADSGFVRLPVGPINGITYYASMRVIDSNSALNVNTALSNVSDFAVNGSGAVDSLGVPGGTAALGFFPSHVGLMPLLADYTGKDSADMENVLRYMNQESSAAASPLTDPACKWASAIVDATPALARTDYGFLTIGDHLASQVARRIDNPGYCSCNAASVVHRSFGFADEASLAYRFDLHNAALGDSDIEASLSNSLPKTSQRTAPYGPAEIPLWYNNLTVSNLTRMRSLLVTSNSVSDFIPAHFIANPSNLMDTLNPGMLPYNPPVYDAASGYTPGSFVQFKDPAAPAEGSRCYEALKSVSANTPPVSAGVVNTSSWRIEEAWTETPVKASINTADFPTLWRAFSDMMLDSGTVADCIPPQPQTVTPIAYTDSAMGWGPFRSPVRSGTIVAGNTITAGQVLQLRAAVAAVNAMDMRDGGGDITSRTFSLFSDAAHTTPAYSVTVYGLQRQPFITMAVADFDGTKSSAVSIELFNPTDKPMDISNWQLGAINRQSLLQGVPAVLKIKPISAATATPAIPAGANSIIPAYGYVLLQSKNASNVTPGSSEQTIAVDGLETVADTAAAVEVVLLRPRHANNTYTTGAQPPSRVFDNTYDEGSATTPNWDQLVPVDSIDFTGVFATTTAANTRGIYERAHGSASSTVYYNWQFVYPGKYDPMVFPSQNGWTSILHPVHACAGAIVSDGTTQGGANPVTLQPIQLATSNWVGPKPSDSLTGNQFPFGGFARNGDMLKVPFIGAYVIRAAGTLPGTFAAPGQMVELNSITMDAAQSDVSDSLSGLLQAKCMADEAVGRFCPLAAMNPQEPMYTSRVVPNPDPYGWAAHFFDYLDVQVASDDFMPNVDPRLSDGSMPNGTTNPASAANLQRYPNVSTPSANPPAPVGNALTNAQNGTPEQATGKQGLININTAPEIVLEQLPGITPTMAQAIVDDRQLNGPFKTIWDLNRVQPVANNAGSGNFQTAEGTIKIYSVSAGGTGLPIVVPNTNLADDPGNAQGDFTFDPAFPTGGPTAASDGVRGDFEERTLMLTRISNLISTRSDSFTCYLLLQGWRNVGTGNPSLAVQRRAAFILDRNGVTGPGDRAYRSLVPTE